MRLTITFLALSLSFSTANAVQNQFPGPVQCAVEKVVDGDTFKVNCKMWFNQWIKDYVRIARIDTPESTRRAKCDAEYELGKKVKAHSIEKFQPIIDSRRFTLVRLKNLSKDKYGRILADMEIRFKGKRWTNWSKYLIDNNMAVLYNGGTKDKNSWCN